MFDDFFNILDLVVFTLFGYSVILWASFATLSLQKVAFTPASPTIKVVDGSERLQLLSTFISDYKSAYDLLSQYTQVSVTLVYIFFMRSVKVFRKHRDISIFFSTISEAFPLLLYVVALCVIALLGFSLMAMLGFGVAQAGKEMSREQFAPLIGPIFFPPSTAFTHPD